MAGPDLSRIAPSFIFESWRWTRERGTLTTSTSMKSILFMCELVEPHKQSPLHKHVVQCLLSIRAFYDPVFLCFYFRYLHDANLWHHASVRHGSNVCFSTSCLCQRDRPATEPAWLPFRRLSDIQQTQRWSINLQENTSHLPCRMIFGADQSPQQISPRVIFSSAKLQIKWLLCCCLPVIYHSGHAAFGVLGRCPCD